jgi:hypothetical protein
VSKTHQQSEPILSRATDPFFTQGVKNGLGFGGFLPNEMQWTS